MQPSMPASGISHFCQELIDKIIDNFGVLDSGRYKLTESAVIQLRACSLISRAFRGRSQKHLFRRILFAVTEGSKCTPQFKRLNDVFSMNPGLVRHVRVLALFILDCDHAWNLCCADPNFVACMSHIWQSSIRDSQLLPDLDVGLRGLPLVTTTNQNPRSNAFETRFIPLIALHVTILEMSNMRDVPIVLFDAFRNLYTLSVYRSTLAPFEDCKRVPIEDRPMIHELSFAYSEDIIVHGGLRFDNLSKVVFKGNMDDIISIRHLLAGANSKVFSLECLDFFMTFKDNPLDSHQYRAIGLNLARMPNLRKVELRVACWDTFDRPDGTDMVTCLAELLGTIPSEHKVEMIRLYLDCFLDCNGDYQGPQDIESHLRGANWAALDSFIIWITGVTKHPFRLSIHLRYQIQDPPATHSRTKEEDTLKDWGQKYLPRTSSSPNLPVDLVTTYSEFSW